MDMHGSNGTDLTANESGSDNGTLSKRIKAINEIPENEITLDQLLMNLAISGNEKHVKLASDLLDLNFVSDILGLNGSDKVPANGNESIEQELTVNNNVESDNLGPDCFDKISIWVSGNQNTEQGITIDNNTETNMEWTTFRPKNKRVRSNSNDSEKINLDITVSPSKKQKSTRPNRGSSSVLFAYLFLLLFGQIGNIYMVEQDSLYFFS